MNKCPNCGKNVSQFALVCPHCKNELNETRTTTKTNQTITYGGKLSDVIITSVITGIIMAIVIYLHDCMNFRMVLLIGDNAYSALIICLNAPNLFVRIILLLLNITICNVVIHFISVKNGYNSKDSIGKCGGDTLSEHQNIDAIKEKIRQSKLGDKNQTRIY